MDSCNSPSPTPPQHYVAIDTETTGLDSDKNGIIQLGAVVFNQTGELVSVFVSDAYPGVLEWEDASLHYAHKVVVSRQALEVNGFTINRIEKAPSLGTVLQNFMKWLQPFSGQTPVAIFKNAPFDCGFMQKAFRKCNVDPGRLFRRVRDLDTQAPDVFGEHNYPRSLEEICKKLEIEKVNNHDALHDALATGKAFFKMKAILDSRRPVEISGAILADIIEKYNGFAWPKPTASGSSVSSAEGLSGPWYGGNMHAHAFGDSCAV